MTANTSHTARCTVHPDRPARLDAISIVAHHHLQSHKGRANGASAAVLAVKKV